VVGGWRVHANRGTIPFLHPEHTDWISLGLLITLGKIHRSRDCLMVLQQERVDVQQAVSKYTFSQKLID
jgi:hypothetical protein